MNGLTNTKNLTRAQEIVSVLARHGFGWLATELNLRKYLPFSERFGVSKEASPTDQPTHLRLAFEELGTTFIKLGQILSTRADLLSPEYINELSKLQDAAPPVPIGEITTIIQAELGQLPSEVFLDFDPTPLATASIGQVHTARLPSGERVVIKVQRPGVAQLVESDLKILRELAGLMTEYSAVGYQLDVLGLVEEFAFHLRCELNYIREGQNADRFRQAFANDPDLHIPQVFWDYTTERVIVLERLDGFKVDDFPAIKEAGIDQKNLAASSVRLMLEEIFVHGIFHADPHPGNLLVLPDGRFGMLDFGMIGRIDEGLQTSLTRLFLALSRGDSDRMIDELITTGIAPGRFNHKNLKRDLDHMIACYADRSIEDLAAARIFTEITGLARRHRLTLPSDMVLMAKVLSISEGLGGQLDSEFQFMPFARPYLERFWVHRYSPLRIKEKLFDGILELADFSLTFPHRFTRLITQIERGELGAQVEVRGIEHYLTETQGMVNRLAMSILVGALIVGLSQFMHMVTPDGFSEVFAGRFLGILFFVATILGFWLVINLIRSGRKMS